MTELIRWPHQLQGAADAISRLSQQSRFVLSSPTGAGKSLMMHDIIQHCINHGQRVALYSSRKLLTTQLLSGLESAGVHVGVRAAGYDEHKDDSAPVQLCMLQTENRRVMARRKKIDNPEIARQQFPLVNADVVLVDEAHMQRADTALEILNEHYELGASIVGITATPLGISHIYDDLIIAGNNVELRACGALLTAYVFACGELDTSRINRQATGEFSYGDIKKKVWTQAIFGDVYQHWKRLNPEAKPAVLFAPGVDEAKWFVDQFASKGVRAASIDAGDLYVDGERYSRNTVDGKTMWEQVDREIRSGEIKVICNRFVLREAIDYPEWYHCILATPIGSLKSYIQIVGRVLRNHHSMEHVIVQDHGGSWWRHGSPNSSRDKLWEEYFKEDESLPTSERVERLRNQEEEVAFTCVKCGAILGKMPPGGRCACGNDMTTKRRRRVIQHDGTLREVTGQPIKPYRIDTSPLMHKAWKSALWGAIKGDKTFHQARGFIASGRMRGYEKLGGSWPEGNLPGMPKKPRDWFKKPSQVPESERY